MIVCNPSPPCSYGKVASLPVQCGTNVILWQSKSDHTMTMQAPKIVLGQHFSDLLRLQNDLENELRSVLKFSLFSCNFSRN